MKTFKELRTELQEAKKVTAIKPKINVGPDISGKPTPNLPAIRPQGTTNLPAVRPSPVEVPKVVPKAGFMSKLLRLGNAASLALEPSELGNPEENPEYKKEMEKFKEKNPTASMGPKQRQRYLEKNKPATGEYIPKPKTGKSVVPKNQKRGETIDAKPKTAPKTQVVPKPEVKAQTQPQTKNQVVPAPKPEVKTQTQPQTKKKIPTPTTPITTDTGAGKPSIKPPIGGGSGGGKPPIGGGPNGSGKSPFIAPPPGGKNNGAGGASGKPSVPDPNLSGGFVTAGISKGPKGELRNVNVARGKVDEPALPHKATGLDVPLQKPSNVPSVSPKDWKQSSSVGTTGTKLPPQGTPERDTKLQSMGYKKF